MLQEDSLQRVRIDIEIPVLRLSPETDESRFYLDSQSKYPINGYDIVSYQNQLCLVIRTRRFGMPVTTNLFVSKLSEGSREYFEVKRDEVKLCIHRNVIITVLSCLYAACILKFECNRSTWLHDAQQAFGVHIAMIKKLEDLMKSIWEVKYNLRK